MVAYALYIIIIITLFILFIHEKSLQQNLKCTGMKNKYIKNSLGGADLPGSRV